MSSYRAAIRFLFSVVLTLPLSTFAATYDVKALIDTDDSRATGCSAVAGGTVVTGIDTILTTSVTVTGTTGTVTSVTRQTCNPGSGLFDAGVPVDSGWNVGVSSIGDLLIESHLGPNILTWDNVGTPRFVFTASSGSLSDVLLSPFSSGGGDIVLPHAARERAVLTHAVRSIALDGNGSDWNGEVPLANGSEGASSLRFISVLAYASANDFFFNFQIHTNPAAPTAIDDAYDLATPGGTLTVSTLGVLNNDSDPNDQPLTAILVDNPQHGTLTLNANGGFTYVNDGSSASQDQFHYKASNGSLDSNIATVTISLTGGGISNSYTFTSANHVTFTAGAANTFAVTVTGHPTPALSEDGALPAGITFVDNADGTGTLSGTPGANTGGIHAITFHAEENTPHQADQSFTLTIGQAPAITSLAATTFTVGSAASFVVTASGFPAPTIAESGFLPNGVTFNVATATLSGTPAVGTGGQYNITFTASNGVSPNAAQPFILIIDEAPSFTSATAVTFQTGVAGSFIVTTGGSPSPAISKTGTLPSGVTFTDNHDGTATIFGTPNAGTGAHYPLTLTASNGVGADAVQNFTLTVNQPPAITSANNVTFTTGAAGSFTVTVTGFPVPAVSESGALPSGVTFNATTKILSGTPGAGTGGIYNISLTAANGVGSNVTQTFTLTVNQAPLITSANTVNFAISTPSTFTITTTGFPTPAVGQTGSLPAGMSFTVNPDGTGTISGTPSALSAGTYPLTITATNGVAPAASQTLTIRVWAPPAAVNDSYQAALNTPRVVAAPGVLGNDTVNGATISGNSQPAHGTVTLATDGSFTYTPANGYTGPDSFAYTLSNFAGNSTATVSLTVFATPVANDDSYAVAAIGAPGVLGNDSVNGGAIASYGVTGNEQTTIGNATPTAQGGTIVLNADGSFTYTPALGFTGTDTFKYTLTNVAGSSTATVTLLVDVAPVNSVPGAQSTNEDRPLVFSSATSNAISISDVDAGTSNVQVMLTVTNGVVTLSGTTGLTITGGTNGTSTVTVQGTIADINSALDGMSFIPSLNDNGGASLQIVTNDLGNTGSGGPLTDTDSVAITINAVNDPPVLTAGRTLAYTENDPPTAIDPMITVTDVDNANLASATVQITGNYVSGQDVLSFANTVNITGVFTPATGTLALTGSDTLANYQTALRNVTYNNTSDNPSTLARTVTWTGNDGSVDSTPVTSTINVTAVNDAPVLTAGGALTYTENDPATAIDTTITVTDSDNANLIGATAQITGNYASGEDILSFANTGSISGSFNPANGMLTLTGSDTLAHYQTALRTVKYANASDNPSGAARTVSWRVNDGAGVNNLSNTPASTINVIPVNDPPVVQAGHTVSYTENGAPMTLEVSLLVTDVDSPMMQSAVVLISGNADAPNDILACPACGGTITAVYTPGSGVLQLTGVDTIANYQAALRSVTFSSTSENPSTAPRGLDWFVTDTSAAQSADTSANDTQINVTAVNDAPVNGVPGAQTTPEDTPLTFSAANSNAISVSDVDANGGVENVTLSAADGILTLGSTAGITITSGANGSASVTFTGTLAQLNAAMDGTVFTPSLNFNDTAGAASITITTDDQGNTGSGGPLTDTDSVNIDVTPVNDPPVLTAGGTLGYTENDSATAIDATITVNDVDNVNLASATVQITSNYVIGQDVLGFTNQNGITGSFVAGTGTLTLTGSSSVANYQTALRSVTYFNTGDNPTVSPRTVTWTVNDSAANSNQPTSTITITAVNDAPVLSPHGTILLTINEDTPFKWSAGNANGFSVSDADNPLALGLLTVTATHGTITFTTPPFPPAASVSFPASVSAQNGALNAGITFTPDLNYNGPAQVVITTNDQGNTGTGGALSDSATINITVNPVNDAPVANADTYVTNEDTPLVVNAAIGVLANDTDIDTPHASLTAILVSGPSHAGSFTLNADGSFSYTPNANFNGSDSFTYKANDGFLDSNIVSVNITVNPVNDAPVANADTYVTNEDTPLVVNAAGGVLANDADVDTPHASLTAILVSGPSHASSFTLNVDGSFSYTPNANFNGSDSFTYKANDGFLDSNIASVNITVNPVNDAPVANADTYVTNEDTPLVVNAASGVLANDTDVDTPHASLTAILVSGPSNAGSFTLNADGSFSYTPNANFNGTDSFTYKANDGSLNSNIVSVNITINPVNDAPVNSMPAPPTVNQDTPLTMSGVGAIQISDIDAGANPVQAALVATNGTMTLSGTAGLSFTVGDGTADGSMTFTGTIGAINTALNGMQFIPSPSFFGAASIQITTNDQGNTGSGGPLQDQDTLTITVTQAVAFPFPENFNAMPIGVFTSTPGTTWTQEGTMPAAVRWNVILGNANFDAEVTAPNPNHYAELDALGVTAIGRQSLWSPPFVVPSATSHLTFRHKGQFQCAACTAGTAQVEISTNNGATWTLLGGPYGGGFNPSPGTFGFVVGWSPVSIALPAGDNGLTARLRWSVINPTGSANFTSRYFVDVINVTP